MQTLIINEATLLKKHATQEEISKLNLNTFDGSRKDGCIYGQMTGDCYSERSLELMKLCCKEVYTWPDEDSTPKLLTPEMKKDQFYSPIELAVLYVDCYTGGIANKIISFLKGETESLIIN